MNTIIKDAFELESKLGECWVITDDLQVVVSALLDDDISKEEAANILIGLSGIYNLRFSSTFECYQNVLQGIYNLRDKVEKNVKEDN